MRSREIGLLFERLRKASSFRSFASLPSPVPLEQSTSELTRLSNAAPTLLWPAERSWGPTSILPSSLIPAGDLGERVAVVRDAFSPATEFPMELSAQIADIGSGSVAISSDISQKHRRLVVDEYTASSDGSFRIEKVATPLLRMLKREGLRVCHVPDVRAAQQYNSGRAAQSRGPRQSTNEVLMVAPTAFTFNEQAAQDNSFMHASTSEHSGNNVAATVLKEFSGLYHELTEVAGVQVNLFQHSFDHGTPDAVFPNNWFSTHPKGEANGGTTEDTLVFYPMKCPNRAAERRLDIQSVLKARGFGKTIDLSAAEKEHKHFEGTGVLVLDRINGVAYVALSERADKGIAEHWVEKLGYKDLVTFHSSDTNGSSVYHTNVMMAIGTDVAVVCLESVTDQKEREHLRSRLSQHHKIVEISQAQMAALCGNVLELENGDGLPVLAMSSQAHNAFTQDQRAVLRRHVAALHHAPINTLEHIAGGGVRCALGEVF